MKTPESPNKPLSLTKGLAMLSQAQEQPPLLIQLLQEYPALPVAIDFTARETEIADKLHIWITIILGDKRHATDKTRQAMLKGFFSGFLNIPQESLPLLVRNTATAFPTQIESALSKYNMLAAKNLSPRQLLEMLPPSQTPASKDAIIPLRPVPQNRSLVTQTHNLQDFLSGNLLSRKSPPNYTVLGATARSLGYAMPGETLLKLKKRLKKAVFLQIKNSPEGQKMTVRELSQKAGVSTPIGTVYLRELRQETGAALASIIEQNEQQLGIDILRVIRELSDEGIRWENVKDEQIAGRLGKDLAQITRYIQTHKEKLGLGPRTTHEKRVVRDRVITTMTGRRKDVAQNLGVHSDTIYRARKRLKNNE